MSPIKLNGSMSGFVALDAPAAAGSNTLVLPTGNGSSGQVLTTNGSGVLSFAQGGRILQVINGLLTTGQSTTSTTYVDSGLSATITPSSSTSKILILVSASSVAVNTTARGVSVNLTRDSTPIVEFAQFLGYSSNSESYNPSTSYLDSPNTISAITYKVRYKVSTGSATAYFSDNASTSTIILMEVAA